MGRGSGGGGVTWPQMNGALCVVVVGLAWRVGGRNMILHRFLLKQKMQIQTCKFISANLLTSTNLIQFPNATTDYIVSVVLTHQCSETKFSNKIEHL